MLGKHSATELATIPAYTSILFEFFWGGGVVLFCFLRQGLVK
jgi:hypothetical protein